MRKISGYPLTLLEIHTLVHVLFALVMHIVWLKKPTNIQDPTLIEADELGFTSDEARSYPLRALNLNTTAAGYSLRYYYSVLHTEEYILRHGTPYTRRQPSRLLGNVAASSLSAVAWCYMAGSGFEMV